MATQVGYGTTAQLDFMINTKRLILTTDDDRNNASDTGVVAHLLRVSANMMWGYISQRHEYASNASLNPMAYTSGDHPLLEDLNICLAGDLGLRRNSRNDNNLIDIDHWVLVYCQHIGKGDAQIPTV